MTKPQLRASQAKRQHAKFAWPALQATASASCADMMIFASAEGCGLLDHSKGNHDLLESGDQGFENRLEWWDNAGFWLQAAARSSAQFISRRCMLYRHPGLVAESSVDLVHVCFLIESEGILLLVARSRSRFSEGRGRRDPPVRPQLCGLTSRR